MKNPSSFLMHERVKQQLSVLILDNFGCALELVESFFHITCSENFKSIKGQSLGHIVVDC